MNENMMNGEGMESEGETVSCVHIYMKPDGSALVIKAREPMPDNGQPAASLDEAFQIARQMAEDPSAPEGEEDEGGEMAAAQAGYNKRAKPEMSAPNPQGLFGE